MPDVYKCPKCGHVPSGFSVAYTPLLKCGSCGLHFCYFCYGSNQGRCCPECRSDKVSKDGSIYART